jgi:hypothetical protein
MIFKSVWGSTFNTMTRIYAGRTGVQNLAEATELYLLQNIPTSSSNHQGCNSMKTRAISMAIKWPITIKTSSCRCCLNFTVVCVAGVALLYVEKLGV